MIKFAVLLLLGYSLNLSATGQNSFLIHTVDENDQPIEAQILRWWTSDNDGSLTTLSCDQKSCSEWIIDTDFDDAITVYAHSSQVKENDPLCWDLYEGETVIYKDQKATKLVLSYRETVCK